MIDRQDTPTPIPDEPPQGGLLPVVVGVVGHRRLANADEAGRLFREAMEAWLDALPNTPFYVLTALAEGADRVAVNAALDLQAQAQYQERIRIIAPLPMPEGEYRHDWGYGTDADREFQNIVARLSDSGTNRVFSLPLGADERQESERLARLEDEREQGIQHQAGAYRNARYALASSHIARHAHILVAFWDGEESSAEGGTAWTVSDFLRGRSLAEWRKSETGVSAEDAIVPRFPVMAEDGLGAIWHIPCPRGNPAASPPAWIESEEQATDPSRPGRPADFPKRLSWLEEIERFNKEARHLPPEKRENSRKWLSLATELPAERPLAGNMREFEGAFLSADAMAGDFQDIEFWRFCALSALLLAALLAYKALDYLPDHHALIGGVFVGLLGLLGGIQWRFRRDQAHHRHLQYRTLAEGLRVQMAWVAAGLQSSVCDHYPDKHLERARWIWHASRGLHAGLAPDFHAALASKRIKHVHEHWVRDQADYLDRKINQWRAKRNPDAPWRPKLEGLAPMLRFFKRIRLACLGAGGLGAGYAGLQGMLSTALALPPMNDLATMLCIVLPLTLAVIVDRGIQTLALEEELDWYASSLRAYRATGRKLERLASRNEAPARRERAATLLLELGRTALHENSVWLDIHRKRNIFDSWNLGD